MPQKDENTKYEVQFKSKVNIFIKNSGDEHGRYKSWFHCYDQFQKAKGKKLKKIDYDLLTLHLSFYLASWGMYRGSSFLLQHDYLYNKNPVELLFNDEYSDLWDKNIEKNKAAELLFGEKLGLINKLKDCYKNNDLNVSYDGDNIASETLVTKILLGTMGCVPAYDRFLKNGIKWLHDNYSSFDKSGWKFEKLSKTTLNKDSYVVLKEIVNGEEFKDFSKKLLGNYPPMKIIDMFLWELGFELDIIKEIGSIEKQLEEKNDDEQNKVLKKHKKKINAYYNYFDKKIETDKMQDKIIEKINRIKDLLKT